MKHLRLTLMLALAVVFCVTPAFAVITSQPDGSGEGTHAPPTAGDLNPGQFGHDLDDHGAPNSGDGVSDGSGWDPDDPGASVAPRPLFIPLGALLLRIFF